MLDPQGKEAAAMYIEFYNLVKARMRGKMNGMQLYEVAANAMKMVIEEGKTKAQARQYIEDYCE
jgi:hypothetical protein